MEVNQQVEEDERVTSGKMEAAKETKYKDPVMSRI
jgi:hypothetical protein